eukprot:Nitzschia sp. Nitz4//scaffold225_size51843//15596//17392//NITZ4_006893-RA/size51843-processed-gene-0.70-mRNA-1//-1//CDS//3329542669//37//frame0
MNMITNRFTPANKESGTTMTFPSISKSRTPSVASTVSLTDSLRSEDSSSLSEDFNINLRTEADYKQIPETRLEDYLYPKIGSEGKLPSQGDATRFLKYLIYVPLLAMATMAISTEIWMRVALRYGVISQVESFFKNLFNDPFIFTIMCISLAFGMLTHFLMVDVYSFVMLLNGKRRRSLPADKRLIHAVVICQYKEPLEVLDATIASLVESTRVHNTMIVLASEARDPLAQGVFDKLEAKYGHVFRNFIKTDHPLTPGEVIGKSSNENYAVRELYKYCVEQQNLDPFEVMVTVCDADSLFDPVYLEHVEAEFFRMPDGRRAIYNAPINTYRNFGECNLMVQAVEMSRCQYDTFVGTSFRPSQSNYSLTLGFCHETDYWDPTNTAEDFHTALKAMAVTGQGKPIVVTVWSLILNDSVAGFKDRWTQAQRHMWGIEECAWALNLFFHLRFTRWMSIMGLTCSRMLLEKNCIPPWIFFLIPAVQKTFFSLERTSQEFLVGMYLVTRLMVWLETIGREFVLRRYILGDRKHMQKAGWKNILLMATPLYGIVEDLSVFFFFTCATWSMLVHAMSHNTIMYVTAPKAFVSTSSSTPAVEERKQV